MAECFFKTSNYLGRSLPGFSALKLCFVINVSNNKTIIWLNLDLSQLGLRPRRLIIKRYSAGFHRIIVKYPFFSKIHSSESGGP